MLCKYLLVEACWKLSVCNEQPQVHFTSQETRILLVFFFFLFFVFLLKVIFIAQVHSDLLFSAQIAYLLFLMSVFNLFSVVLLVTVLLICTKIVNKQFQIHEN